MKPDGGTPAGQPTTAVRRMPDKQRRDPAELAAVLDAGVLAHVGFEADGWPYVLPVAYAPWRDGMVIHGSTGSRLFRALAGGARVCATVTHLDALVLARSAFESSMSYRCAMVFGVCRELAGADEAEALDALTDHLLPGRRLAQPVGLRPRTRKEDAATLVLHLPAEEWSVKVGTGFAEDPEADLVSHADLWGGVVRIRTELGPAEPDPTAAAVPVPPHVAAWLAGGHPAFAGQATQPGGPALQEDRP